MKATRIQDLKRHTGEEVEIRGWLYNRRSSGGIHFLILRDGTGIVQCILDRSRFSEEEFESHGKLPVESSVIVRGQVKEEKRAPGGVEVALSSVKVLSEADLNYPIQKKAHNVDFLLDHRHLWIRSPAQAALLKIRATVIKAIEDFLDEEGYIRVDAPILTPAACEGTTTLFEVKYFDQQAFLSQSGQLYNEATAMALGKVYCFGPTFRAEKSKTRRHLTEFWMVEPEMAFATLDEIMDVCERFVSCIVQTTLKERSQELSLLKRDVTKLEAIHPPFASISYTEAVELLNKHGYSIQWGSDFGGDEETLLSRQFSKPVMIHHYPARCKAFYMKPDPADPKTTLSVDMLAPEGYGEIIGGGQREDDYDALKKRIQQEKLPPEAFEWYLDLRKYGSAPHGGFGLGVERTVAWIAGIEHVREAIPFPRTLYRLYP